jgi:acyl carrier protein
MSPLSREARANREEILAGIAQIIEEITGTPVDDIYPELSFVDDLDIDSLSMVMVATQTEEKYGVRLPDEDLAGIRTIKDLIDFIVHLEEEHPELVAAFREHMKSDPLFSP